VCPSGPWLPLVGGDLGKWSDEKTEPTDKLTLLSGSIASGESRTRLRWLPSALQHSILLILNPALPRGPQDSPEQPPEASKRPWLASANAQPPPWPSLPSRHPCLALGGVATSACFGVGALLRHCGARAALAPRPHSPARQRGGRWHASSGGSRARAVAVGAASRICLASSACASARAWLAVVSVQSRSWS